jgi:hypothetical protein
MANITYRFTAGTKAQADQVNKNFDDCMDAINLNINSIEQINNAIEGLETSSANINGDATKTFSVADPILNSDAVNKNYLKQWTGNVKKVIEGYEIHKQSNTEVSVSGGICIDTTGQELLTMNTGSNVSFDGVQQASSQYDVFVLKNKDNSSISLVALAEGALPNNNDYYYRQIGYFKTNEDNEIYYTQYYTYTNTVYALNIRPDYSAGISITSGYVAPSTGFIIGSMRVDETYGYVYVNGVEVGFSGGQNWTAGCCSAYVQKGDVITFNQFPVKFYPCTQISLVNVEEV